jgi:hypothetical protein
MALDAGCEITWPYPSGHTPNHRRRRRKKVLFVGAATEVPALSSIKVNQAAERAPSGAHSAAKNLPLLLSYPSRSPQGLYPYL